MSTVYKYGVYCNTESQFIESWSPTPPLCCPHNNSHIIDPSRTEIRDAVYENITQISPLLSYDGKPIVQNSPRPAGTMTYITGRGDDISDPKDYGNGISVIINHFEGAGDDVIAFGINYKQEQVYVDFNTIENLTYISTATVSNQNMSNDLASCSIVPVICDTVPGTGTAYRAVPYLNTSDAIIIPAIYAGGANTGNIAINNFKLVQVSPDSQGLKSPGYWDATWNKTTKVFENITPAPGTGLFNMFAKEVELLRFVNDIILVGTGAIEIGSQDVNMLGHGMRFRINLKVRANSDHNCSLSVSMRMYRKFTNRQEV